MSVKLLVLKSGEDIVCDIQEMVVDEKVVGYLFENPYRVKIFSDDNEKFKISFFPWIPLSKQEKMLIPPDWVVTMVEPIDEVVQLYSDKKNGKDNKNHITYEQSDSNHSD